MKRTPMKRTAFRREGPTAPRESKPRAEQAVKPPKCKHCRKRLDRPGQKLHDECIAPWWAANGQKVRLKAERVTTRARREKLKRIHDLIADCDKAFSSFIRERDRAAGFPCISSGKPLDWSGNKVDAGHYRSRGAASHLRYHEDNCHAQTKQDNQWKAGNVVEYRIRLVDRIGIARVEALEADNTPHKWMRGELIAKAAEYRQKARELKKARGERDAL